MQPANPINWILSIKGRTSFLLLILLLCLTFGCSFVPSQEQFVTSTSNGSIIRDNGSCSENNFYDDNGTSRKSSPGLNPEGISILDWNLYKEQRQDWDIDFRHLSSNKDIVFLQEASLNEKLRQILHQKEMYWSLNSAFKFNGADTGVLMASTIKPFVSCGLRHSEPIIGTPKTALISSYPIAGSPYKLLVANIHSINFSLGVGAYQEQLNSLADIIKHHDGPIIIAGDFNSWSKKRTAIMMRLVETLSLQTLVFNSDIRTTFYGDPVDHIFYRGLEPISSSVHQVISSDHNPISATFRLSLIEDADATQSKPL